MAASRRTVRLLDLRLTLSPAGVSSVAGDGVSVDVAVCFAAAQTGEAVSWAECLARLAIAARTPQGGSHLAYAERLLASCLREAGACGASVEVRPLAADGGEGLVLSSGLD